MAYQIDVQAFLNKQQDALLESKDEVAIAVKKNVVASLSAGYQDQISNHSDQIKALKSEADGPTVNKASIAYHEKMLAYYMS